MALELSSLAVVFVVNLIMAGLVMIIVVRMYILPRFMDVIATKLKDTDDMMKAGASAMGKASADSRQLKKLEKMVVTDIIAEFPEIELLLEYVSPDTADMLREHPEKALKLYQRYKLIIDQVMGKVNEEAPAFQY